MQLSGQVKGEEATSLIKTILGPGYNIVDTQILLIAALPVDRRMNLCSDC